LGFGPVLLDCGDITPNGFLDILDGFFPCLTLADATGEAGALHYPIAVFPWIDNNLSHVISV
jgi:hypothetical protein